MSEQKTLTFDHQTFIDLLEIAKICHKLSAIPLENQFSGIAFDHINVPDIDIYLDGELWIEYID